MPETLVCKFSFKSFKAFGIFNGHTHEQGTVVAAPSSSEKWDDHPHFYDHAGFYPLMGGGGRAFRDVRSFCTLDTIRLVQSRPITGGTAVR